MEQDTCYMHCKGCPNCSKSIFAEVNDGDMDLLNEHKVFMHFKKGQLIFQEGGVPHGLYCVNSGKVKVYQTGDEGREQIVRFAKDADVVGYRALLSGERYLAAAAALEDTTLCFVPKEVLFQIMERNLSIYKRMTRLLTQDLKNAEHKITELAQKPVRERVAETLLYLKETYGLEEDGQTLNVRLSREEIANIVGTATETVIRLLSEFKKDGYIELENKRIKILNTRELVRVARIVD